MAKANINFRIFNSPSFPVSSSPPEWIAAVDAAQRIARGGRAGIAAAHASKKSVLFPRVIELPEKCPL
jgi:hypothetical protein